MKKLIAVFFVLIIIAGVYADISSIIGDYRVMSGSIYSYITFYSDGTCSMFTLEHEEKAVFTYYVKNDILFIADVAYYIEWNRDVLTLIPAFGEMVEEVYLLKL